MRRAGQLRLCSKRMESTQPTRGISGTHRVAGARPVLVALVLKMIGSLLVTLGLVVLAVQTGNHPNASLLPAVIGALSMPWFVGAILYALTAFLSSRRGNAARVSAAILDGALSFVIAAIFLGISVWVVTRPPGSFHPSPGVWTLIAAAVTSFLWLSSWLLHFVGGLRAGTP